MQHPIINDTTDVRLRSDELDEVWWQGRQWAVTAHGMEKRDGAYHFDHTRLNERWDDGAPGWLCHMGEKVWLDHSDFATGFLVALALHGITEFTRDEIDRGLHMLARYQKDH